MPEVTKHAPGAPSYAELSTTDEKAALAFYGTLFDWTDDPQPMGPDVFYHMQTLKGLPVAALYQQGEEERSQNIPAHWRVYFTVDNVDQTIEKAKSVGGSVVFGPMDVFDAGRMVMLKDPQGAIFACWQPKEHIGARLMRETGAIIWNELMTTDAPAAVEFYKQTLGIDTGKMPGPMDYSLVKAGGDDVAGIMAITPEMGPVPPHWGVYFGVVDVDATLEKAKSLGGNVLVSPQDIPEIGRFAVLQDPQSAAFSIFKPF